ncbi:MAG TPA: hypothetical protein VII90_01070 [Anaerolineales bacterium]
MPAPLELVPQRIGQHRLSRRVDTVHRDREGVGGFSAVDIPGNFMHHLIVVHR